METKPEPHASAPSYPDLPSLDHLALVPDFPPDSLDPEHARLSDRQRLSVVLEAAALLSHLHHAGYRLVHGLEDARIGPGGRLVAGPAVPGRPRPLPQARLRRWLLRVFRVGGRKGEGGVEEIAGRGEARRSARALLALWRQELVAVAPDRLVAHVLEAAPFLWAKPFADARRSLVCGLGEDGGFRVAGPGRWRRRVNGRAKDRHDAVELVAGDEARELWAARPVSGGELGKEGEEEEAGEAAARVCFRAGRFGAALEALGDEEEGVAPALRLWCLYHLGRLEAARRALRRLDRDRAGWSAGRVIRVAEVAVRLAAAAQDPGEVRRRRDEALAAAEGANGQDRLAARLVAASASWDLDEPEALDEHLAAAEALLPGAPRPWRFEQIAALRDLGRGDGDSACGRLETALTDHRRDLAPHEAAGLWNDVGVARGAAGAMADAERAFRHAVRLFERCDGPRRTTLALQNLAEVQLRRGELRGVPDLLARARRANREADNFRGVICDAALEARHELARGRPDAARVVGRNALRRLDEEGSDFHRGPLTVLTLRAAGWRAALAGRQGLGAERDLADRVGPTDLAELEPEERPAFWALAGRSEEADRAVDDLLPSSEPLADLWRALLAGEAVPAARWRAALGEPAPGRPGLDPSGLRTARLVLDAELVRPGSVPGSLRRRAVRWWREVGAADVVRHLEAADADPWRVLTRLLEDEPTDDLATLYADAGFGDVRLDWEDGPRGRRPPCILVDGLGGPAELRGAVAGGELILRAVSLSPPLEALFAATRRVYRPAAAPASLPGSGDPEEIVGRSPILRRALDRLARFAASSLPVLVHGESGTGKELAARFVHRRSPRRDKPFVPVNSAALSGTLVLSDLFGHARGAFTGADRERAGVFETAQGGTVFLDEIGDLPAPAQGMLLRVLQEGEVRRLGETLTRKVDVRVVAATHRDLEALADAGRFRRDLLFRLRGAAVTLPPLRDRGDDVLLLAEHLTARGVPPGETPPGLSAAARAALLAHPWPGNVRELGHALDAARALAGGGPVLDAHHLEMQAAGNGGPPSVDPGDYHARVEAFRRRLVEEALDAAGGRRAEAARRLGLTRQALSYLVRKMGLTAAVR